MADNFEQITIDLELNENELQNINQADSESNDNNDHDTDNDNDNQSNLKHDEQKQENRNLYTNNNNDDSNNNINLEINNSNHDDPNEPLKKQTIDDNNINDEANDLLNNSDINLNQSSGIYGVYMRRESISTSDIPHSLQVLTPQHQSRPKDDILATISDMGFDRNLAERAYDQLLNDYGNHDLFTTEQIVELMLSLVDDNDNDGDIIINDEVNDNRNEEEEFEAVDLNIKTSTNDDNVNDNNLIECPICRMDKYKSEIYETSCFHNYCNDCLQKHYRGSIENGVVSFKCMESSCLRKISRNELFLFLNEIHKTKYIKFERNVKLAKDTTIRWCVKAGCDTPIKRKSRKQKKLKCTKCNTFICYNCAGLYYNTQRTNDSTSSSSSKNEHNCNKNLDLKLLSWAKNSNYDVQFCPKCLARIEKLSGCNHMQCTYCKYEFCWLCRRQFKKGHYDPSNILFGCPNSENSNKKPNKCGAICTLFKSCMLMCCLPARICWWRMNEQGLPWCCCWCCCD